MRTRSLAQVAADGDGDWFSRAIESLEALRRAPDESVARFIATDKPVTVGRAPGRLDVMGGIADYSGSLVLEMPLACATYAFGQRQDARRLDVLSLRDNRPHRFGIGIDEITSGALREPRALADWFAARPADRWAAYVVGSVFRCLTLNGITAAPHGLKVLILSEVPEGKGVSSSAALEVATMSAAAACFDVNMDALDLAAACQWAENHIARAPCGIMDQMTSALGRRDRLLRLCCQPATVEGHLSVPAGYRFYGIDSGVRHAVSGSDYGTVRTAAFMGYRMIADIAGLRVEQDSDHMQVDDNRWGGYLANVTPAELATDFVDWLPSQMRGADFLARYGGITDAVTRVDPDGVYPVRQATSHPVHEHDRVRRFAELLSADLNQSDASKLGALMFRSHASYSACGLGSDGTDRLVDLVADAGPEEGLFGAKITGGGSGGTVAILGTAEARGAVHHIARQYEQEMGVGAYVFDASGPGADELGTVTVG